MKYEECPYPKIPDMKDRSINPRSMAFARRAMKAEREKLGLFAYDSNLTEAEWLEKRFAGLNQDAIDRGFRMRQRNADSWREARKIFYSLPKGHRIHVLRVYNQRLIPKEPSNLRHTIEQFLINNFYAQIGSDTGYLWKFLNQVYE